VAHVSTRSAIRISLLLLFWSGAASAQDLRDEVAQLKRQVAAQQAQIDQLLRMADPQSKLLAAALPAPAPTAHVEPAPQRVIEAVKDSPATPNSSFSIAPTGFIDFAPVWRSKTVTSGLPTNFAAIPFRDTVDGQRRQVLSSAANTRLGVQVNAVVSGLQLLGVVETDFLGYQPGNLTTTTNSYGLRLRLAFVDLHAGKWEFLAGQGWSLMTPARRGIPALGSGLVLTQDLDPNIQSGLVWARAPQARAVYRPKPTIALALSVESGGTYAGGSAGAGTITLPSALAPDYFHQVDLGSGALGVPNAHSDWIGKVAFDPRLWGHNLHLEIAGLLNQFAFYNPLTTQKSSTVGGGGSFNAGIEIRENLTLFTTNFYSDGGGRMIYGEAPALVIRGDGAPSLVHSMSTMDGVEFQVTPKLKMWAYYGGTYICRNVVIDPSNGADVGYGYPGSPDSQNRSIQEITGGLTRVFWQDSKYGTLQFSGQFSWLIRYPWSVGPGRPASANLNMVYMGLRYILPAVPLGGR
jgi:hypothetical protein